MQKTKLAYFYFDYISPNAYLAWSQLPDLVHSYQLEIQPVSVLFTGLLRATGQMGPAEQPAKQRWMAANIARKAALLNLPLRAPKHHPFNPLLALRLSSIPMEAERRWQLIDALMRGVWEKQKHLSDEQDIRALLDPLGFDSNSLIAQAQSPKVAAQLRQQTDEAIKQNVFGIPTVIFEKQLFFGYDDFTYLEMALEKRDPLNSSAMAQTWLKADWTASSQRKELDAVKK